MPDRSRFWVPLLGLLAACHAEAPAEPAPVEGPARAAAHSPERADAPRLVREGARTRAGQPELRRIAWPGAEAIDRDALAQLSDEARQAVASSRLPVLAPRRAGLLRAAKVVAREHFSAVAARGEGEDSGLTVSLSATDVSQRYTLGASDLASVREHADRSGTVRGGKPAWVLENEGIWSVSWEENGASRVLELECATAGADPRCQSSREALRLVEELAFVGGAGAEVAR